MTTLITVHNSNGFVGRCDAKCHDAIYPDCNCVCGGRNHGVGSKQAAINTHEHGMTIAAEWKEQHPDTTMLQFDVSASQLPLF